MIAGSVAVRIEHNSADADDAAGPPTRKRIEYVIAVPNDSRWLSIDLSVEAIDGFDIDQTIAELDQGVGQLSWSAAE